MDRETYLSVAILILLELTLQSVKKGANKGHSKVSQSLFYWN